MIWSKGDWVEGNNSKSKVVEYCETDFYGPFLILYLEQWNNGIIRAIPVSTRSETAEFSSNDFLLLSKASKELYQEVGKFILKTKLFDVKITSENAEELILKKLKDIKLF